MIKAILFDFNGVLINDEPLQMRAYQDIFKEDGVELTEEGYLSRTGMDDHTFIESVYREAGLAADEGKRKGLVAKKFNAWKQQIDKELPIFPGVENFVKKARRRFELGIVSMANLDEISYVLAKAGLRDCFSVVLSSGDVSKCKPDPECYNLGFRLVDEKIAAKGGHSMARRQCVAIEDVPQGIEAAKGAGLRVIGISNTFPEATLRVSGADAVMKTFDDLNPEALNGLLG